MIGPRGYYVVGVENKEGNSVDINEESNRYIGLIYINYKI